MKIGITERGDPSIDFSWVAKMEKMDGVILITKNLTDAVIDASRPYLNKMIFHVTCTGMGGTSIEPNIPPFEHQLKQAEKLLSLGVEIDRVVIRIDPIVPTQRGLTTARMVFDAAYRKGFRSFRISLLDCYPHVRQRFLKHHIIPPYGSNGFSPFDTMFACADDMVKFLKEIYPGICIESCAEPKLTETEKIGCVSEKDLGLLGLSLEKVDQAGYQRKNCLCCSNKTELLAEKKQCPYGCLYCYWKD